jgi:acetylornithine aminotransferase/acetylornithine/N-succinyldiaminopimelate aminotransferase
VAIEFLRTVDGLMSHLRQMGRYFREKLEVLQAQHASILEVRGMGLMLAIEIDSADTAKATVQRLLDRGILINRTHETVLRFLPPYIIQKKHVDEVIRALDSALASAPVKPGRGSLRTGKSTRRGQIR